MLLEEIDNVIFSLERDHNLKPNKALTDALLKKSIRLHTNMHLYMRVRAQSDNERMEMFKDRFMFDRKYNEALAHVREVYEALVAKERQFWKEQIEHADEAASDDRDELYNPADRWRRQAASRRTDDRGDVYKTADRWRRQARVKLRDLTYLVDVLMNEHKRRDRLIVGSV